MLVADFGGGTSDFSLVQLQAKRSSAGKAQSSVIGTDGVGIAGDTFDSKLVRNLVAPMLGLGSQYKSQFGKVLPVPNWLYSHLERWHYLSFLKTRKNMDLLRRIRGQALEPQKIDALIDLAEGPRMMSRVIAIPPEEVKIGMAVKARIIHENDLALVVFEPA